MESKSLNLSKVTPKKLKSSDYEMGKTLGTGNKYNIIYININKNKKFLNKIKIIKVRSVE